MNANDKIKKARTVDEFLVALYCWGAERAKEGLKEAEENENPVKQAMFMKSYLAMQKKLATAYSVESYEKIN